MCRRRDCCRSKKDDKKILVSDDLSADTIERENVKDSMNKKNQKKLKIGKRRSRQCCSIKCFRDNRDQLFNYIRLLLIGYFIVFEKYLYNSLSLHNY